MKNMRKTAGYNWTDYKTNIEIVKVLNVSPNSGHNMGLQKKLDTSKQNAL